MFICYLIKHTINNKQNKMMTVNSNLVKEISMFNGFFEAKGVKNNDFLQSKKIILYLIFFCFF